MKRAHVGFLLFGIIVVMLIVLQISGAFPSFEMIKEDRMMIEKYLMQRPFVGVAAFSFIYIAAISLSIPIATPLTLLAGFLFGAVVGTLVVVVSATVGATVIFLLVRYFFYESFKKRLAHKTATIDRELESHGFRDVLLLRLAPVVPFALINAAMALTEVKLREYALATFFGIVPFTFVYVLAGKQLGEISSLRDVVSFETLLVVSLIVLSAVIPIAIRRHRSVHYRG